MRSGAFLLSILASSTILFVAGCNRSPGPSSSRARVDENRVVRLFIWREYINPEIVDRFTRETGIRVEIESFGNQEELVARVRSSPDRFDIIVIEDCVIEALNELGLLRELDPDLLPNRIHLDAQYRNRPSDPEDLYSVPYHWGTTLLAFRKDLVGEIPRSWSALWDPRFAGHIWLLSDVQEVIGVTALELGYALNIVRADALDAIRRRVLEQVPVVGRYADTSVIKHGLVEGACWLASIYSGDAAQAARENPNVDYFIPEEGAPMWMDNLSIPRDAPNVREAHALINFLLVPEIAALNANYLRYATPNASARRFIDPDLLADPAIFPPEELRARCRFYEKLDQPRQRFFNRLWADIVKLQQKMAGTPPVAESAFPNP